MVTTMENKIYKPGEFAKMVNVTVRTLQRWDKTGVLMANRTQTNRRYYTHEQYLKLISNKVTVVYLSETKLDKERMDTFLADLKGIGVKEVEVVRDDNSKDGFKRLNWQLLLERCLKNEIEAIYIGSEKDLPESGLSYYKRFFEVMNVEIKKIEREKQND